jgi:hypothetical protein
LSTNFIRFASELDGRVPLIETPDLQFEKGFTFGFDIARAEDLVDITSRSSGPGSRAVIDLRNHTVEIERSVDEIPEGETRELSLMFWLDLTLKSPKKPLTAAESIHQRSGRHAGYRPHRWP